MELKRSITCIFFLNKRDKERKVNSLTTQDESLRPWETSDGLNWETYTPLANTPTLVRVLCKTLGTLGTLEPGSSQQVNGDVTRGEGLKDK